MSLRSWPIRTLFPMMAASIVLAALVTCGGAFTAAKNAENERQAVKVRSRAMDDVTNVEFLEERIQLNSLMKLLVGSAQDSSDAGPETNQAIHDDLATLDRTLDEMARLPLDPRERASVRAVRTELTTMNGWLNSLPATRNATDRRNLVRIFGSTTYDNAATLGLARQTIANSVAAQHERLAASIRFSLILVVLLCLMTAVVVAIGILQVGRSINARLAALRTPLQAMAAGDLTQRVPAGGQQELAEIGSNVNAVVDQFSDAFASLNQTSSQLGNAAAALEELAADVGRKAEETSARADTVARTADEVSQNVQAVAAGGAQMGGSIAEISRNANQAAQVAVGAVQAAESTTASMNKLGESSREIGDVIRLITSIAEQTNLLALNATIEAARAGDAGRGFAVVADEVGQLAQETARATEKISARVETIQLDAVQAAQAISEISGVITRINEFQATIASAVEEQTATTQSINAGVGVAATGSGQIASSIAGVADAAGLTAQSMSEAHDSARKLSRMSEDLAARVAAFRLG